MPKPEAHNPNHAPKERLQRVLADAGIAARRACEQMIEDGRVKVNGERITRLPVFVNPHEDRIEVDGRPIPRPERLVYVMLHKPERTLVTSSDEEGLNRRTIMDLVQHPSAPRLYPVGRLGYDTTGLVFLTNDGELAHRLSHPKFAITKGYHAVVKGMVAEADIAMIQRRARDVAKRTQAESNRDRRERAGGAPIPGPRKRALAPMDIRIAQYAEGKTVLEVTLVESRNRPLEEVLLASGLQLRKLTRISLGPLQLRGLPLGNWRELTREELRALQLAAAGKQRQARPLPRPARLRPERPGGERAPAKPSVPPREERIDPTRPSAPRGTAPRSPAQPSANFRPQGERWPKNERPREGRTDRAERRNDRERNRGGAPREGRPSSPRTSRPAKRPNAGPNSRPTSRSNSRPTSRRPHR